MYTLGSLFDGIGGFPLAATRFGVTPLWASEIEKGPTEITKKHFPNMEHLGDILAIDGRKATPVDIITFGSPCQDLSVAGKRAGLAGERSGLFMEAVRIIKEMRDATDGRSPRFAVWENVPGAFSSNGGEDFRAVIEELCRVKDPAFEVPAPPGSKWEPAGLVEGDGWSIAWRVLDAQYWGVPQRRKRIFVVADFGGNSAGQILFERESLRGNSAKGESAGQGAAADAERGAGAAGGDGRPAGVSGINDWISPPIQERYYKGINSDGVSKDSAHMVVSYAVGMAESPDLAHCLRSGASKADKHESTTYILFEPRSQDGVPRIHGDVSPSLNTAQGGQRQPCVTQEVAYALQGNMIGRELKNGPQGDGINEELSFTINTIDRHAVAYAVRMREGCGGGGKSPLIQTDRSGTIATGNDQTIFAPTQAVDVRNLNEHEEVSGTLQSKNTGGYSLNYQNPIRRGYKVRRLTPTECERLQGFPDGWTDGFSDTVRYKALGNSVAVPCVEFVLSGIVQELYKKE